MIYKRYSYFYLVINYTFRIDIVLFKNEYIKPTLFRTKDKKERNKYIAL